jgi:S1-C subfamily serine protease
MDDNSRRKGLLAEIPETIKVVLDGQPTKLGLSWREDEGEPQSVYVTRVVPYSPAARAGIQLLDRICALGGMQISGQDDLLTRILDTLSVRPEAFQLTIETRGRLRDVEVNMGLPAENTGDQSF